MKRWLHGMIATLLLSCSWATAQETGYTIRETDLRAKPFLDALVLVKIPEKTPVTIVARQAGWIQVKSAKQQGWVRMLSLKLGSVDPAKREQSFLSMMRVARARPAGEPTVTTGVRGFSEEDLKAAKPNPEAVDKMQTFFVARTNVMQFADNGKLLMQTVPYVDAAGQPEPEKKP